MEPVGSGFLCTVLLSALNNGVGNAAKGTASGIRGHLVHYRNKLFGRDYASVQRRAFAKAVRSAANLTIRNYPSTSQAEEILVHVDLEFGKIEDTQFALELSKILSFSEEPDVRRLAVLIDSFPKSGDFGAEGTSYSANEIASVLVNFISNLRNALLDEPAYANLLPQELLRHQREIHGALSRAETDDEFTYQSQMKRVYDRVDFIGIPDTAWARPSNLSPLYVDLALELQLRANQPDFEINSDQEAHEAADVRLLSEARLASDICQVPAMKTVIVGGPGSGKTTLLKRIAANLDTTESERSELLPIFASLREFSVGPSGPTFEQFLVQFMSRHLSVSLSEDFFRRHLEAGKCVVCLDGIDEVPGSGAQSTVAELINSFASRFPNNRIFVTSRTAAYSGQLDSRVFARYRILPFSPAQITEYLTNWFRTFEPDIALMNQRVETLTNVIADDGRLSSLAGVPLLLTIMALIHQHEAVLPKERFRLYEKCITTMMETWDQVKGATPESDGGLAHRSGRTILEGVSYEMQRAKVNVNEQPTIGQRDLENLIASLLVSDPRNGPTMENVEFAKDEARRYVRHLLTRSELLVPAGNDELTFPHLTFQEYLAASYIDSRFGHLGFDELWNHLEEFLLVPSWREVVLLLLGILTRSHKLPTLFVQRMLDNATDDPVENALHRKLFLAAETGIDGIELEHQVLHEVVDRLLSLVSLENHGSRPWWGAAGDALDLLRKMVGEEYVVESVKRIISEASYDGMGREAQFELLAEVGGEQAQLFIQNFMEDTTNTLESRFYAAQSLVTLGSQAKEVGEVMKEYVRGTHRQGRTVPQLARYIAKCTSDDGSIFETLKEWTVSGNRGWITGPALEGVIAIGISRKDYAQEVIGFLQRLVAESKTPERVVHSMYTQAGVALDGMSNINRKWGLDPSPCLELAGQVILDRTQNRSTKVAALKVLHHWQSFSSSHLSSAMEIVDAPDCDAMTKVDLILFLESISGKGLSEEDTLKCLSNLATASQTDARGRVWALEGLITKGKRDDQTVDALISLAMQRGNDWIVAADAVRALGRLSKGDDRAKKALTTIALDNSNTHWVRGAALRAIGNIAVRQDEEVISMLTEVATNESSDTREYAYDGLRRLMTAN